MGRSVIDTVLADPGGPGIVIGGHLPIGLLAPIRYQPHPGPDREQSFVFAGAADARLLAWRTQNRFEGEGAQTRFVVRPLAGTQWRELLDREISVRAVLAEDGPAVRLAIERDPHGGGSMRISPTTVRRELPEERLPPETLQDEETDASRPNRPAWLALPRGSVRDPDEPEHADALAELRTLLPFGPTCRATTPDGATVEAYGYFTVTTDPEGDRQVRVYRQQLSAEVAVERAAMG